MKSIWIVIAAVVLLPLGAGAQDGAETTVGSGGNALTGMVFQDDTENGIRDVGEIGVAGIIVDVLDPEGNFLARVITDADGKYSFKGVETGTYFLRFEFSLGNAVRSKGIDVRDGVVVFSPIPVIGPDSNYSYLRLGLMNPGNFKGEEVSAFQP